MLNTVKPRGSHNLHVFHARTDDPDYPSEQLSEWKWENGPAYDEGIDEGL